jgi:hypothetical protein
MASRRLLSRRLANDEAEPSKFIEVALIRLTR